MLREYENSILFVQKCLYIHKYTYISYEINIREIYNLIYRTKITHKISETNSSFHLK